MKIISRYKANFDVLVNVVKSCQPQENGFVVGKSRSRNNTICTHNVVQWNLNFTIWQGDSKIISLNRDIVVNELLIYK